MFSKKICYIAGTLLFGISLSYSSVSRYLLLPTEPVKKEEKIHKEIRNFKEIILQRKISINVSGYKNLRHILSLISDRVGIPIELRDYPYLLKVYGEKGLTISYYAVNKPLKAILDEIASMYGLWWEYKDGKVIMYRYKPATFSIQIPSLQTNLNLERDFITIKFEKDYLKDIEKKLKSVLLDQNSKVSVSSSGEVVVMATPKEIEVIKKAIDDINKTLNTPIPLNIKVILIKMEDRDKTGVDWNLLLSKTPKATLKLLGSTFLSNTAEPIFQAGVLSASVESILSILSQSFDLKIVQDTYLNAYSGFPVVYAPTRKKRIISEYSITFLASGATGAITTTPQVILKTEDIMEGTITVLAPRLVGKDKVLIELYRELSKIEELQNRQVEVQGFTNEITLPTISQNIYSLKAQLEKGETLVLISDLMNAKELQNAGIPFLKDLPLVGKLFGYTNDRKTKYQAVILISYLKDFKEKASPMEFRRKSIKELIREGQRKLKIEKAKNLKDMEVEEDFEDEDII